MKLSNCKYGILMLYWIITACLNNKSKVIETPDNLISIETMANILTDIHIADAGVQRLFLKQDSTEFVIKKYYALIEKKYQVSFETINQSFNYYLSNPALMDSIYTKAIEKLTAMESSERALFIKNQNYTRDSNINTVTVNIK